MTADREPEPDVAVIVGDTGDYAHSNPPAASVGLVVEVADDSLARDRGTKGSIYARARIATYWIVNLVERRVEVYETPTGEGTEARYAKRTDHTSGEIPVVLRGVAIGAVSVETIFR